jgi:hypothetical protein
MEQADILAAENRNASLPLPPGTNCRGCDQAPAFNSLD